MAGVAMHGKWAHLVVRNLTSTRPDNDGFNLADCQNVVFKNIRAIDYGDDGDSAHGVCRYRVDGFQSIGNATGICDSRRQHHFIPQRMHRPLHWLRFVLPGYGSLFHRRCSHPIVRRFQPDLRPSTCGARDSGIQRAGKLRRSNGRMEFHDADSLAAEHAGDAQQSEKCHWGSLRGILVGAARIGRGFFRRWGHGP